MLAIPILRQRCKILQKVQFRGGYVQLRFPYKGLMQAIFSSIHLS
jgi:hypothetical protein